jgi:hypothetical protein
MSQTQQMSVFNLDRQESFKHLKKLYHHVGIILDGDCPKSEEFLVKVRRQVLLRQSN